MFIPAKCPICGLRYIKHATTDYICPTCFVKMQKSQNDSAAAVTSAPPAAAVKPKSSGVLPTGRWQRVCARCDKVFTTNQPAAKYCSRSCKENAKKARSRHGETKIGEPAKTIYPDRSKGPVTDSAKAIPCAYCGTLFIPKTVNSRYCSNRCAERVKNMRKVRTCPSCGRQFKTSSDDTKYCINCRIKFWMPKNEERIK